MTQNTLTNDIFNPAFPSELVWSGYVKPGAAAQNITLPAGLYRLQMQGQNTSILVTQNSWGANARLLGNSTIWLTQQETSVYFVPQWRNFLLQAVANVTNGSITNFIYDGTNYATASWLGSATTTSGNQVYAYSTDLINWSTRSINPFNVGTLSINSYGDSGGLIYDATGPSAKYFVSIPGGGVASIFYSTDSITWSAATLPGTVANSNASIIVNPNATNRYVWRLQSATANTQVCTSTNGITWTSRTGIGAAHTPVSLTTNGTASTNQIYVIGLQTTAAQVATSTDGVTWTTRSIGALEGTFTNQVLWFSNKYWFIPSTANGGGRYATSTDGVTWTINTWPIRWIANGNFGPRPIVAGDKLFSPGVNANDTSWWSTDGVTWTPAGNVTNSQVFSYVNNIIIAATGTSLWINDEGSYMRLYRMDNQVVK